MSDTLSVPQVLPNDVVVVGASHAAVQFADRLRAGGFAGAITLVSQESHLPYQRPPLSKAWLQGHTTPESILLRDVEYYANNHIELLTSCRVRRIIRTQSGGVMLGMQYANGSLTERQFGSLVLATGARARRLELPGADHPDVVVLRELDDARRLTERISAGPTVVIGGGFVGLEVAATLRSLGADVTVVEAGTRLMGRAVGTGTAGFMYQAHHDMGVRVLLGAQPVEIVTGEEGIRSVRLSDGTELEASTVLVGIGAVPRTELAQQLGLSCDNGIVVDEHCRTSDGSTLAIGDCTLQVFGDGSRMRLESVDNAMEQANVAARTLLAAPTSVRPAPWFWSDQGDWKIQMVGSAVGHTSVVTRIDPAKPRRLVTLYFTGEALTGAECVNSPADFVALRSALNQGNPLTPQALANSAIPLKKLLTSARH